MGGCFMELLYIAGFANTELALQSPYTEGALYTCSYTHKLILVFFPKNKGGASQNPQRRGFSTTCWLQKKTNFVLYPHPHLNGMWG